VSDAEWLGPPLLLDTCVYVDILQDGLPAAVETLLKARRIIHFSVVLGELSHSFGRLDPSHRNTAHHLQELADLIDDLPPHRIDEEISAGSLLEAGIVSGLVFRLGGFQPNQEVAALIDASLYMHALERGYTVLTRNIRDFDFINQIVPSGRMLFYRNI
jgi:predicted nucleic acid-binding protein